MERKEKERILKDKTIWQFDASMNQDKFQYSNKGRTIKKIKGDENWHYIYGDKVMSEGVHKWTVKIDNGY